MLLAAALLNQHSAGLTGPLLNFTMQKKYANEVYTFLKGELLKCEAWHDVFLHVSWLMPA